MVQTEPPGAAVRVNDRAIGDSPVAMGDLEPGHHRLHVELAGYAPVDLSFPVAPGAKPTGFSFNMVPLNAPLRVTSDPPGALITVDGARVGATPLETIPVTPGRHEVRVEMKGYRPQVTSVHARAGRKESIHARLVAAPAPTPSTDARNIAAALPPAVLPMPTPIPVFEGMFVSLAQVDRHPVQVSGAWATRPDQAIKKGITGTVAVDMAVTETGEPTDLQVTRSAGPILDEAVLKALRSWKFTPAVKNGVRVRTRVQRTQTFR
jgi:TonB family protein